LPQLRLERSRDRPVRDSKSLSVESVIEPQRIQHELERQIGGGQ
jgi:hypothetical protein